MSKTPPKRPQKSLHFLKWPKFQWNLQNKKNNLETSENNQNTVNLSQNTPEFLDFEGILVDLKSFCSF